MNIGIDARCFARGKTTGVEGYTKNFLTAVFSGDATHTYHIFFNAWKAQHVDLSWMEAFPNVHVHRFRIPNKLLNSALWFFRRPRLDRLVGGVDVFFAPNTNFIALSAHVPLIITAHDLSFEHFPHTFSPRMRLWHYIINPRILARRATHTLAVSASTKDDVCATYRIPSRRVHVALNGPTQVAGTIDRNNADVLRVKNTYDLPYRFILFFGTIEPRKNIHAVLQGFAIYRSTHPSSTEKCVIAGAHGWNNASIYAAIATSRYRGDVIVLTDIPDADKEPLMVLASVVVYPSLWEGFGFPPLEALTCNTPVITSHSSSLPEVVGKYAIMIDPHRPEEIAHALGQVLHDRALRAHLTADNHATHVRTFTWRRTAQVFYDVLATIRDDNDVEKSPS